MIGKYNKKQYFIIEQDNNAQDRKNDSIENWELDKKDEKGR